MAYMICFLYVRKYKGKDHAPENQKMRLSNEANEADTTTAATKPTKISNPTRMGSYIFSIAASC